MLFPLFLAAGVIIPSHLSFNPYELSFKPAQMGILGLYFLFMGIAFFLGAGVICLSFIEKDVREIYFYNLTGSGAGVLAVAPFSFYFHPVWIMAGICPLPPDHNPCDLPLPAPKVHDPGFTGLCPGKTL